MNLKKPIILLLIILSSFSTQVGRCKDASEEALGEWLAVLFIAQEQLRIADTEPYEKSLPRLQALIDTFEIHNMRGTPVFLPYTAIIQKAANAGDTLTALEYAGKFRNKVKEDYSRDLFSSTSFSISNPSSDRFFADSSKSVELCKVTMLYLAQVISDDPAAEYAFDAVMQSKCCALQAESSLRNFAYQTKDKEAMELYSRIEDDQNKFYHWDAENKTKFYSERENYWDDSDPNYSEYASGLVQSIKANLTALLEHYAKNPKFASSFIPSWKSIQSKLKKGEYVIEFGRSVDPNYNKIYLACIISKDCKAPILVPLPIFDELEKFKGDTPQEIDMLQTGLWKPLLEKMPRCKAVYFTGDYALNSIPIECALENIPAYRLSTSRELLKRDGTRAKGYSSVVLYGGLFYDNDQEDNVLDNVLDSEGTQESEESDDSSTYLYTNKKPRTRYGVEYLENSFEEINAIDSIFSSKPRTRVLSLSGTEGTEESFRKLQELKPDIIHLSTHGFFWSEEKIKELYYISYLRENNWAPYSDRALQRSGILLSQANKCLSGNTSTAESFNDGVLTGNEIAHIYLGDVDLITLSACQSGVGDIKSEGVVGLQRSFKLSGAKSLLMSLWEVDDQATMVLMKEFYRNLLKGKTKVESLKRAQNHVKNIPGWESPRYWAAWILLDAYN